MKRLLILLVAMVATLFGATKLNLIDVRPLANGPAAIYLTAVSATGIWTPIVMDPAGTVIIDTSVSPAVLKAAVPILVEVEDDFTVSVGQTVFVTSAKPKTHVRVYRNGLLQRPFFTDYTETAAALTTVTMPTAQTGDGVVLVYQK